MKSEDRINRRVFIKNSLRFLFIGTGVGISYHLLNKKKVVLSEKECDNSYICRSCQRLADCQLPQGSSARKAFSTKEAL